MDTTRWRLSAAVRLAAFFYVLGMFVTLFSLLILKKGSIGFALLVPVPGALFLFVLAFLFLRPIREATATPARLAMPPPEGFTFTLRVVGVYKPSARKGVGGDFYLSHDAIVFVPHRLNIQRDRQAIVIPRASVTSARLVPQQLTAVQRYIIPEAPPMLRISVPGHTYDFLVPRPDEIAVQLG